MSTLQPSITNSHISPEPGSADPNWLTNASLLWQHRRILSRITAAALVSGLALAFLIPRHFQSTARIMPPDQGASGAAMLAALAGHSLGALGSLGTVAGSLFGARNTSALFVDLLHSRTVCDRLIDRFNLQHVYRKRYRVDTVKYLVRHTTVTDDKKSGVISITVDDTDPARAQQLAQAYLDELNRIVTSNSVSSARQERIFIEHRLHSVEADLEAAQLALSDFSSTHATIDIKEQTRAMVDAGAKLQAQLIVGTSELSALEQIYGSENVRVRAARARVSVLQSELSRLAGSSAAPSDAEPASAGTSARSELYPPLRQMPRLAVPFTDLYRRVRVQETVFELLTQQYEMARIQEAKDMPVVSVVDPPLLPEKKSFPPRLLVALAVTAFAFLLASACVIARYRWAQVRSSDTRKLLAAEVLSTLRRRLHRSPFTSRTARSRP